MDENHFADFASLQKVRKAFEEHLPVRFCVEIPTKHLPSTTSIPLTWFAVRPDVIKTLYGAGLREVLIRDKAAEEEFKKMVENEAEEEADDIDTTEHKGKQKAKDDAENDADGEGQAGESKKESNPQQPKPQKPPKTTIRVAWMEVFARCSYIIVEVNHPGYDISTAEESEEHETPILPVFVLRLKRPPKSKNNSNDNSNDKERPYFRIENIMPGWALVLSKRCVEVHRHFQRLLERAIEDGQDEASLQRLSAPYIVNNIAFQG